MTKFDAKIVIGEMWRKERCAEVHKVVAWAAVNAVKREQRRDLEWRTLSLE